MIFQAIHKYTNYGMRTEHVSCIYDEKTLMSMQKAGYKFKIDGKPATIKQIKEYVKEHKEWYILY